MSSALGSRAAAMAVPALQRAVLSLPPAGTELYALYLQPDRPPCRWATPLQATLGGHHLHGVRRHQWRPHHGDHCVAGVAPGLDM